MIKYFIGIDPDSDKSGVAVWKSDIKKFTRLKLIGFFDLLEVIKTFDKQETEIHIEASWLHNKTMWLGFAGNMATKIAADVGANRKVGKLLNEYCEREGYKVTLHKPMGRKTTKTTHETFVKLSGWSFTTNQEVRDAGMLVLGM